MGMKKPENVWGLFEAVKIALRFIASQNGKIALKS